MPLLIAGLCCASTAVTQDREAHLHDYPALSYPHVFVLQVRPSPVPVGLSCRGCAASRCARCASMPPRCVSVYAQPTVHFGTCFNPASPAALPLQGGFKAFWRSFSELCEGGYVPMDHKDYTQQFKVRWWKFEVGVGWGVCLRQVADTTATAHACLLPHPGVQGGCWKFQTENWRRAGTFVPREADTIASAHACCDPTRTRPPCPCPSPAGVPQRREAGVGAHHPHLFPQAAPAAALVPAAPEHRGGGQRQQGRGTRGARGGSSSSCCRGGGNGGGGSAAGSESSPAHAAGVSARQQLARAAKRLHARCWAQF